MTIDTYTAVGLILLIIGPLVFVLSFVGFSFATALSPKYGRSATIIASSVVGIPLVGLGFAFAINSLDTYGSILLAAILAMSVGWGAAAFSTGGSAERS